jgi:hypothetical protein
MMTRAGVRVTYASFVSMVLALPLLGAVLAGRDARDFLRFPPPLEIPSDYLRFSWLAAVAVIICVLVIALPWLIRLRALRNAGKSASSGGRLPGTAGVPPALESHNEDPAAHSRQRFPIWGTAALIWTAVWWVLAWTRWDGFAPLQRYTFFPLWFGFIVAVNAATQHRTGSCLMLRATRRWSALFVVSAACWWVFEWLNRFVENWHYLGAEGFGPASYAVHASLCFSTVLPAVAAVAEWIGSHRRWNNGTAAGPRWRWLERRGAALALGAAGGVALVCTGAFPRWSYPALWVAPLALFLSASVLTGRRGLVHEMARGDWSRAMTWMIAALICGFFWELWNWQSAAKWIYTVPGVERWPLFEMPALGYAGYLPFGLECLLVSERVVNGASLRSEAAAN